MPIKLYELLASRDARCSAYCWRARMALRHKQLDAEFVGIPFTGMDRIAFSGAREVPVLVDGERTVAGSIAIARHLEQAYPDRPSLFGGPVAEALCSFIEQWIEAELHPRMLRMVIHDLSQAVHPQDRDHFRETRTQRMGGSLEAIQANRDTEVAALRKALEPLRKTLRQQPFLSGAAPAFADHLVFSTFQWCRLISPFAMVEPDDPIRAWLERMLDFDQGYARRMPLAYAAA